MNGDRPGAATLADVPLPALGSALRDSGIHLDLGAVQIALRGDVPALAPALRAVYGAHAFAPAPDFADLHIVLARPAGPRRWLRPQALLRCDGLQPFEPFPASHALPLFEWGANWLIGQRLHHLLLLHAGAVERDGCALVLPATPGAGKSTLTAALSLRGWRLLSDEFGAFDPQTGSFRALLKPIALKNASIDVIRIFDAAAQIGPAFEKTRKGTVAHLVARAGDVRCRHVPARPAAFVLPRWQAGQPTRLEPVPPEALFGALAFNAFNYRLLGAVGFDAVLRLVRTCPAWQLVYSDLDDAIAAIDARWAEVMAATPVQPAEAAP
jgi:HprK-related kinase A